MQNKELAARFRDLARVLEYQGENPFKIRSYRKAYDLLRKRDQPVAGLDRKQLIALDGIGPAIADKILVLTDTGEMPQLEAARAKLPPGASELLDVRGIGPKKAKQLVEGLEVESVGELLQAIRENRVVGLKGFSYATQDKLREQLEFHQNAQGMARYADLIAPATEFLRKLQTLSQRAELTGELRRQLPVISEITYLVTGADMAKLQELGFTVADASAAGTVASFPARIIIVSPEHFVATWLTTSSAPEFLQAHPSLASVSEPASEEPEVFAKAGMPYVPPAQREADSPFPPTPDGELVQLADIQGVVHAHTTWSDGSADLDVLANSVRERGFGYLVVTDHSRAAGYANGLSETRILSQIETVKALNATYRTGGETEPFRIFTGTECDILRDGDLDYSSELLAKLDCVIISVHSVLRMDMADATRRLVRAIEHEHSDILGHPTGRLLLARAGYPLDMDVVLDACAANGVAIEVNANPNRLDLDWTYVRAAADRGIPISINPDAHSLAGVDDLRWGVAAVQKAGLRVRETLNARSANDFAAFLERRGSAA